MFTTCAFPIVQLDEISDEAIVRMDRLDITETPRCNFLGLSSWLDSSDDLVESKKDMLPKSGVSSCGAVSLTKPGVSGMYDTKPLDTGGDVSYWMSSFIDGGGARSTGDTCSVVYDELAESVIDRKETRLTSSSP